MPVRTEFVQTRWDRSHRDAFVGNSTIKYEHYCSDRSNFDLLRFELFDAPTLPAQPTRVDGMPKAVASRAGAECVVVLCSLPVSGENWFHIDAIRFTSPHASEAAMLWTIFVVLLILWLLGLGLHFGGVLINLLLVVALAVLVIQLSGPQATV
jgi:hypothetical protein